MTEYIYEHSQCHDMFGKPLKAPILTQREEIVRCKDCRYAKHLRGRPGQLMKFCRKFSTPVEIWRYCSWGERASNQKK